MTYIVACNQCGSGKKLYFKRYNPMMKDGEEPFVWVEYDRDQMKTNKTDLEKGCPSCGCKDLEIIDHEFEVSRLFQKPDIETTAEKIMRDNVPEENEGKRVLDVTCGGRMMWFEKNRSDVIYSDFRTKPKGTIQSQKGWSIEPDVVNDFRNLPYQDESFSLVVLDPPHILRKNPELGKIPMQYGVLHPDTWKKDLSEGFDECWRVLKKNGVLVFKWNEANVSITETLSVLSKKPLFGHTTARSGKTKWMCFIK